MDGLANAVSENVGSIVITITADNTSDNILLVIFFIVISSL